MIKFLQITLVLCLPLIAQSQSVVLEVRAYAQGFYSPSLNEMVPVVDPITYPTLCDTATIVLIDSISGQGVYCDQVAFSTSGYGASTLPASFFGGSFQVGVRFRNTLHILSLNTIKLDSLNKSIDLTVIGNVCCDFDATHGVATAYSGDINHDGTVDVIDVTLVGNDNNTGVTGYVATDLNGDGVVDNLDVDLAYNNNNLFLYDAYSGLCLPTGIVQVKNHSLNAEAFPNPFSGNFKIQLETTHQQINVSIFDAIGKLHYSKHFDSTDIINIQTGNLTSGFYFVQIIADGKKIVLKLLSN